MEFNKDQNIVGLKVLNDNVIWLWEKNKSVVVVDPAVSKPVIKFLNDNNLNLEAILQTHHHADHIGGTEALLNRWPDVKIIASKKEKDRMVKEFNIYKKNELSSLMQEMNPIISEYVKEKSIDLVLDKKNILIGKTSYDITQNILELVNTKLK